MAPREMRIQQRPEVCEYLTVDEEQAFGGAVGPSTYTRVGRRALQVVAGSLLIAAAVVVGRLSVSGSTELTSRGREGIISAIQKESFIWIGEMKVSSGLCIIAPSSAKQGTEPTMSSCDPNDKSFPWVYDKATRLLKTEHGICLDAPYPKKQGSKVHMWKCYPSLESQQWEYNATTRLMRNTKGGLCLAAKEADKDGSSAHLAHCDAGNALQQWEMEQFDAPPMNGGNKPVSDQDVYSGSIQSKNGICLNAPEPRKNGGKLTMRSCHVGSGAQWVHDASTGSIWNLAGVCLDEFFDHNGGEVHMWKCYPALKSQQWVYDVKTGLLENHHGFCLNAKEPLEDKSEVNTVECDPSAPGQQWVMASTKGGVHDSAPPRQALLFIVMLLVVLAAA